MIHKVCSFCAAFAIFLLLAVTRRPLLANAPVPEDFLTQDEIIQLIAGKTVQVTFSKQDREGFFYFDPNGELQGLRDNWLEQGHWEVTEEDRLCLSIAGGERKCRMLIGGRKGIRQYVVKKDGNHRLELTYEKFSKGNRLLEFAGVSSPPLEQLNKKEIIALFSGMTVESETVRQGRISLTYYSPDGTLKLERNGKSYNGTWRGTDNDRMCLKLEDSQEKCRMIVKEGNSYSKYIVKKNGQHQQSVKYRWFMHGKRF